MQVSTVIPTICAVDDDFKSMIEQMDELVIRFNQCDNMPDKTASLKIVNSLIPKLFILFKEDSDFGCYYFSHCVRYFNAQSYLGQAILLILKKMAYEEHDISSIYMLAELYRVNYVILKPIMIEMKNRTFVLNSVDSYYQYGADLGCKKCQERLNETKAYINAKYILLDNCSNSDLKLKRDMEQLDVMEDLVINHNRADLLPNYVLWLQMRRLYSRLVSVCDFYLNDSDFTDKNGALKKKREQYAKEAKLEKLQYYIYKIFTAASFIVPVLFVIMNLESLPFKVALSMGFVIYLVLSYLAPAPLYPFKVFFSSIFAGLKGVANDDNLWDCIMIYSLLSR